MAAPLELNIGLLIKQKFFIAIMRHTWEHRDEEVCGVLIGKHGIARIHRPMRNASEYPSREFQFDPVEQLEVWRGTQLVDLNIVAIYHSHTIGAPYPSATDIKYAAYPKVHYIITTREEMRAYRILDGTVIEEKVVLDG